MLGYNYMSSEWYEKSYSIFDKTYEKNKIKDEKNKKFTSSILKKFPYILLEFNSGTWRRPNLQQFSFVKKLFCTKRLSLGHQILRSKFQTFLKVFEKMMGKLF